MTLQGRRRHLGRGLLSQPGPLRSRLTTRFRGSTGAQCHEIHQMALTAARNTMNPSEIAEITYRMNRSGMRLKVQCTTL